MKTQGDMILDKVRRKAFLCVYKQFSRFHACRR